ncbi:beta-lactamase domain protein [Candidatus Moduliflexus flocculans]|uniref:Beta-lactamase domain protein n=1 Tax=Candidatus Moduliflexus flocculans TaxID=1499966 RepID=A0A081BPC5_9BACT|nr:beta-lactamase domain protein [Candidatus Moduliflexus flocculans]
MLKRMLRLLSVSVMITMIVMVSSAAFAQDDVSKIEITSQQVADGVYVLNTVTGGNIGLSVGDQGIFMVDTGQAVELMDKIMAEISKISPQPVRLALNTHWHFDHIAGNEYLGQKGVTLLSHENVWKRLTTEQKLTAFNMTIPPAAKEGQPVETFSDAMTLHLNGDDIVISHPGAAHTDGDALVYWQKANVLQTGDLYFEGLYPFIDVEHGGSINFMIDVATKVMETINDTTKIIPGHGPVSDKAKMQAYVAMLTGIRDNIRALIAEGKTMEDIVAAKPTQQFDNIWGKGFLTPDQFTQLVYSDLIREKK